MRMECAAFHVSKGESMNTYFYLSEVTLEGYLIPKE